MFSQGPLTVLDLSKSSRSLKDLNNVDLIGNTSTSVHKICGHSSKLDILPDVSPDSGIISHDDSHFGTDSPSFLTILKASRDCKHAHLTSCDTSAGDMNNKPELVRFSQSLHEDSIKDTHQLFNQCFVSEPIIKASPVLHREASDSPESRKAGLVFLEGAKNSLSLNKFSTTNTTSGEDINSHSTETSHVPLSTDGNIIISSPYKIGHGIKYKKRRLLPKKTKSLLLKHKRSTLYTNLFGLTSISEPKDTANCGVNKGSINNDAPFPYVKQAFLSSVVSEEPEKEAVSSKFDNNTSKDRSHKTLKGYASDKKVISGTPKKLSAGPSSKVKCDISITDRNTFSLEVFKQPPYRSRRNTYSLYRKPDISLPERCLPNPMTSRSLHAQLGSIREKVAITVQGASLRKRVFKQSLQETPKMPQSAQLFWKPIPLPEDKSIHIQPDVPRHRSSYRANVDSVHDKFQTKTAGQKIKAFSFSANTVPQHNSFNSVFRSIKPLFANHVIHEDVRKGCSDNPFTVDHPTSFANFLRSVSPKPLKPKAKKPKLHVMMRKTTRKKKKKPPNNKNLNKSDAITSSKSEMSGMVASYNGTETFIKSAQDNADALDLFVSEERLPLLTSFVQPSKILALSRLNVVNSVANMDGPHLSGSSTDVDQSDWSDKRAKKRYRLLYRKSKHTNIMDPAFATDLDSMVLGFNGMSICENPADNYIKVRPGEMPLPSIFRVIKIDMNRKLKDKLLIADTSGQDKVRFLKPRKDTPSPYEPPSTPKIAVKGGRRRSCSDHYVNQRTHMSISDSCDQCLPPKKRHRLMNMEASLSDISHDNSTVDETPTVKRNTKSWNRKEGPTRKTAMIDETKQVIGRQAQSYLDQELTIDTSSFTTGESSFSTPTLSPSKQSTRSSTLPSLSSLSPSGSSVFSSRHHSRNNCALTCAAHILSSSSHDCFSSPLCSCLEPSPSPGRLTRSLSVQISESSCSSERPVSSSEPSPVTKDIFQQSKNARKRRKSSSICKNGSEPSPPRLEEPISISPGGYPNNSIDSEPPEITCSPFKRYLSPRWRSSRRVSLEDTDSPTSAFSPLKKLCSNISHQNKHSDNSSQSQNPSPALLTSGGKLCNKHSTLPYSDYEPLPLEHCRNRKLVSQIQASTATDSSSSDEDGPDNFTNTNLNQPPRKNFQKVGLFSDFYKDEGFSKKHENVVKCQDKQAYVREEHRFGLMPQPLHIGQFYMKLVQDFQLPYDIWWQCIHQQVPKKSERASKLRTIRANVDSDDKGSNHKLESSVSNCIQQQTGNGGWAEDQSKRNMNGSCVKTFSLHHCKPKEEITSNQLTFDSLNHTFQHDHNCSNPDSKNVFGVKSQLSISSCKLPEKNIDDCKDKRKPKLMNKKYKDKPENSVPVQPPTKPMTYKERCYARKHRTFLVRNVDKSVTKKEMADVNENRVKVIESNCLAASTNGRSVKTRLAAYAKDDPEIVRRHQLAQIFDRMLTELMLLKDEDGYNLVGPLMLLPSHKKEPQYYEVVKAPIDLSMIKERVKMGFYHHLCSFDADMMLLFNNVELYYGSKSDMGQVILKLRHVFNIVKASLADQIDELLGPNTSRNFIDSALDKLEKLSCREDLTKQKHKTNESCKDMHKLENGSNKDLLQIKKPHKEEDVIRCICGVTRDEGLMLQCEKCMIWQHCDCVQASGEEDHYLCDRCEPRYYDPEILLVPPPPDAQPDCTYYLTFVRDNVQYAVGDCVYVMRDCKRTPNGTPLRSSYSMKASFNPDRLDVFRLQQLWKNSKGEKFANGTPYLRPQETFHEPTRKFYHNELFRTPNFEMIPMDLVAGKCVVMDPGTYIKGRPKGFKEQDVYICEFRVDKTAHLFYKIPKIWYPINTSRFCFSWFDKKLNIKRTFLPHKVPDEYIRKGERNVGASAPASRSDSGKRKDKSDMKTVSSLARLVQIDDTVKNDLKLKAEVKVHVTKGGMQNTRSDVHQEHGKSSPKAENDEKKKEQKHRLEKILIKLLSNLPGKQKIDLTYLLDKEKRICKKVTK